MVGCLPRAVYQDELLYAFADLHPAGAGARARCAARAIGSLTEAGKDDRALLGHMLWAAAQIARSKGLAKATVSW